jgi:hypothetical protein
MDTLSLLIALLPIVFILHDFEEIIMYRPWLTKHREEVGKRFPRVGKILSRYHSGLSTSAFAIAVLHEFLVITIITYLSLWFDVYYWWFATFMVFSLHLFVHIGQWIIYGKYVPFIITSLLALPYSISTFYVFTRSTDMSIGQLWIWTIAGVLLGLVSFPSAFFFASRFEIWKKRYFS